MSLREAVARVLSSDPASNYLGTAATVLDLVAWMSTVSTQSGVLITIC